MPEVLTARDGGVLTITLNRPEVYNAFNRALHDALRAALEEASDPAVRAVVITGAGRGFCAGQDLHEFAAMTGSIREALESTYHPNIRLIRALEKPVIAAVNGPAAGAGLSLAAACDIRIASEAAGFVPGFVGIGLVPDSGGSWFIHRLLGFARALEWMSSNRRLDAAEALAWGLVSEVIPADAFEQRVAEIGSRLGGAADAGRGDDQAPVRARARCVPRFAARARGRAAAGGARDGGLRRRSHGLSGEAGAELHRQLGRAPARFRRSPMSEPLPPVALETPRGHPLHMVVTDDLQRNRLTVFFRLLLVDPAPDRALALGDRGLVPRARRLGDRASSPGGCRTGCTASSHPSCATPTASPRIATSLPIPSPPFGAGSTYPVDVEIAPAAKQSRLTIFFRICSRSPR